MKLRVLTGVAILFFLLQTSAFALSARTVYNNYKKTEKQMELKMTPLKMVAEMNQAGTVSETTIYTKGEKTRVDSVIKKSDNPMMGKSGMRTIMIDDGVTSTVFHPTMGKMSNPSKDEDEDRRITQADYLGAETVSGLPCHKIRVVFNGLDKETLWISKKYNALVKEKTNTEMTINSNFKKVKGFMVPFKTVTYDDGSISGTTIVKSAKTGVKIPNSKFDANKVKGFKSAKNHTVPQMNDKANQTMDMMSMAMEIQRLHMAGETEKAEALSRKMQKMQMRQ